MLKVLILANKCKWKTWDTKISQLKAWFSPALDLQIDLEHTSYSKIPWQLDVDSNGANFQAISQNWYDEIISKPAKARGYDIVIFTVRASDWKGRQVQGARTNNNLGIEEIQMIGNENARYDFNGIMYEGDQWFNIARHELCHSLYNIKKLTDNTHKWWTAGNLQQVLKELSGGILGSVIDVIVPPKKYKYFNQSEIDGLKPELVDMLDDARGLAGIPFVITSGLRSKEKNEDVGGVSDSSHTKGEAVDIRAETSEKKFQILIGLLNAGCKRIGLYPSHIHADISLDKPKPVVFLGNYK